MTYSAEYLSRLTEELLRVTCRGEKFKLPSGEVIEGATETDTIKHLTSSRDYYAGRKFTFPGIGNGWEFESAIQAAGFQVVRARNYRNTPCNVVTM